MSSTSRSSDPSTPRSLRLRFPADAVSREHDVLIGSGLLERAGQLVREVLPDARRAFVLTDVHVSALYATPVRSALMESEFATAVDVMPSGESAKTLPVAEVLFDRLMDHRMERGDVIVGLGGGVVTDVAGFIAATYLRGIAVVHLPTSLLAQVDAAIGGKTGVNVPRGKNIVGAFHQPHRVVCDVAALCTLPERELRAGLAEIVKCAVIAAPEMLTTIEERVTADGAWARDEALATDLVTRAAGIKVGIVSHDEREAGERMHLNFGHTIGHALEAATGYRVFLHGEAVAIGMVCASRISEALAVAPAGTTARISRLLERIGLPTRTRAVRIDQVIDKLQYDKKMKGGSGRFVLTRGVGSVTVANNVPDEVLAACLADVLT